jgi:membrane associated rhomboid family serine protease
MFMHGGWLHLLGNMWFLWVFGNNVEDSMGRLRFVVCYLLCGMVAAAAQIFTAPGSLVPMVGASGAIGGIMGAYIALYPRVKVHMMLFFGIFFWRVRVPAYLMLGVWAIAQVLGGVSVQTGQGGTAYMAHIGGFIAGVLLIWLFQDRALVEAHRRINRGLSAESM